MKYYTLLNKETSKQLTHPRLQTFWCGTFEEAQEMLKVCHGHIKLHFPEQYHLMLDNFVLADAETGEEVVS